jgi:hypothetical protein
MLQPDIAGRRLDLNGMPAVLPFRTVLLSGLITCAYHLACRCPSFSRSTFALGSFLYQVPLPQLQQTPVRR